MSDITINVKAPSVNVNATPQSNVIAPKMQMIRGGSVTVDDELSLTSENPVQNKVVTAALNEKADIITDTASGSIASFPDGADGLPVKSLVCNIEPVQAGSGDPSPDNIRPISGHEGLTVQRTGKNLCGDVVVPTTAYNVNRVVNPVYLKAGQYTISFSGRNSVNGIYVRKGNSITFAGAAFAYKYNANSFTFTADEDEYYYFQLYRNNSTATWEEAPITHAWLELGSTATAYEPYHSDTLPISWETEAGTVYGGTLAINQDGSCDLTVADANIASYNGETLPSTWISDRDVYAEGTTPTIGAQVVYKLATPTVYHLPSVTMLKTLLGTNNVWCDTGDVEVKYPADTKLYIDNLIASLSS